MRIVKLFLVALLVMMVAQVGYSAPATDNLVILGNNMGAKGVSPMSKTVRVRYAYQQSDNAQRSIASGDVLVWDTVSADGVTVSICTTAAASGAYAGVAAEAILTVDNNQTVFRANTRNWGLMVVEGMAMAKIDTSAASTGESLYIVGPDGATATVGAFGGIGTGIAAGAEGVSHDIGVLLLDPAADGVAAVWLR